MEYVKEGARWVLRVLIDRAGGVGITHCEAISRALEPLLDEHDPISGPYVLEVSSAGLERPLKRPEDFARMLGRDVLVRLYTARQGEREFVGKLVSLDGDALTLEGHPPFSMKTVALARLYIQW
ncbi:MAG: ribosome maturation factor RimP [Oscillospiraceae bacterium]|nr:ribosome maturation factor RimP [Oscillospiraceae bacterium]